MRLTKAAASSIRKWLTTGATVAVVCAFATGCAEVSSGTSSFGNADEEDVRPDGGAGQEGISTYVNEALRSFYGSTSADPTYSPSYGAMASSPFYGAQGFSPSGSTYTSPTFSSGYGTTTYSPPSSSYGALASPATAGARFCPNVLHSRLPGRSFEAVMGGGPQGVCQY
jgi:hypothetical protein